VTFYTLRLLELPPQATSQDLERGDLDAAVALSLAQYAERCGAYGLSGWAEEKGLPLYYVDNCWVRCVIQGRDLGDFCRDVLGVGPVHFPQLGVDCRYLLEAEEY
jgi:hypothetical protein